MHSRIFFSFLRMWRQCIACFLWGKFRALLLRYRPRRYWCISQVENRIYYYYCCYCLPFWNARDLQRLITDKVFGSCIYLLHKDNTEDCTVLMRNRVWIARGECGRKLKFFVAKVVFERRIELVTSRKRRIFFGKLLRYITINIPTLFITVIGISTHLVEFQDAVKALWLPHHFCVPCQSFYIFYHGYQRFLFSRVRSPLSERTKDNIYIRTMQLSWSTLNLN